MTTYKMPDGTPYLGQDYVMPDLPRPPPVRQPPPPDEVSYGYELGAHRRTGQRAILESKQHYKEHEQDVGLGFAPGSKLVYDPASGGYIVGSPDAVLNVPNQGPYGSGTGSPDFEDKSKGLTPDVYDPGWFAHDPLRVRAPRRVHPQNISAPIRMRIINRCIVT